MICARLIDYFLLVYLGVGPPSFARLRRLWIPSRADLTDVVFTLLFELGTKFDHFLQLRDRFRTLTILLAIARKAKRGMGL